MTTDTRDNRRSQRRSLSLVVLIVGLLTWRWPTSPPVNAPSETIIAPVADAGPVRHVVAISLAPPELARPTHFRWEPETAGLFTAMTELALGELRDVRVTVDGAPPSPGVSQALTTGEERWRGWLAIGGVDPAVELALTLCDPEGACDQHSAVAPRTHMEQALPALISWASARLGASPREGSSRSWGEPVSADTYAILVAGRGAATWYGLLPAVPEELRGSRTADPIARAVFIDPNMSVARWVQGRRLAADGDLSAARASIVTASVHRASSPVLLADEAALLSSAGSRRAASVAWDAVLDSSPGDPRFLLAQAHATLLDGRVDTAHALTEALAQGRMSEPAVAALRVAVADARGRGDDYDDLLTAWQQADLSAAEPVRRRVRMRSRDGRLQQAWDLLDELARRTNAGEVDQLRMALGLSLGRWEDAATAAERIGNRPLAARIRARGRLTTGEGDVASLLKADPSNQAKLVLAKLDLDAGRSREVLVRTANVLQLEPARPEALAMREAALRSLGSTADADKLARLRGDLDPSLAAP